MTLVAVAYAGTPVPTDVQPDALKQQSVIYYSNGKDVIGRIGTPRVNTDLGTDDKPVKGKVPLTIQRTVLALEDHNFWTEAGVSPTGTVRAVLSTALGGQTQGGSTITQQMARNYYGGLSQQRSVSRKFKEILISVRLGNDKPKDYILKTYLNTINLGRGTYGIQAASTAYFRKDVSDLKVNEGCLLAAMIQRPTYFHTTPNPNDPAYNALYQRWNTCLDDMVKYNWLSQADRQAQKYPDITKEWSDVNLDGQNGYLQQRVLDELAKNDPTLAEHVKQGGYKVITTFNKDLQDYTVKLVHDIKNEKNLNLPNPGKNGVIHFGLATVDPKTGEVIAAYGGPGYKDQNFDDSWYGSGIQPGSSMKPYVLATALQKGYSLHSLVDGDTPQTIAGTKFNNDSPSEKGVFDFVQMTAQSINTAYVWLGQKVGLQDVVKTATDSGILGKVGNDDRGLTASHVSLPLGTNLLSPIEQASGYGTFANKGKHVQAHVVKEIWAPDTSQVQGQPYANKMKLPATPFNRAFDEGVARDATYAMTQVVAGKDGTGHNAALPDGRDVAGKTGTTSQNRSAWFVGFTPQLATSVAMFRESKDGKTQMTLQNLPGYSQVYGGQIPAETFSRFMAKALDILKIPPQQFDPPVYGGSDQQWATRSPTASPSASSSKPTCKPGQGNGGNGGLPFGGQNGQGCGSKPPTGPSNQPCYDTNVPAGCNPNLPPQQGGPLWCREPAHKHDPSCLIGPTGQPTNGNGGGGTNPPTGQSLGYTREYD